MRIRNQRAFWLACIGVVCASCECGSGPLSSSYELKSPVPAPGKGFEDALAQSLGVTVHAGNRATFVNDEKVFDAIEATLSRATSNMHLLLYIWKQGAASDRVVAAVTERARAGVQCRIMVDAFGSLSFEEDGVGPALREAGCEVREFRAPPTRDIARNHRKLVIVDGRVGITGGFGIRDDWLTEVDGDPRWRDTNVRITGPVVADMQRAFLENWLECGGTLLPAEAFPLLEPDGPVRAAFVASTASPFGTRAERLVQLVLASAKKRIWMENAYFVPSDGITAQLMAKVRDGLDIRILAPGKKSDSTPSFLMQRNEYGQLMKSGIRIFEYQPTMMHAKTILVDDLLSVVGTVNLEPLSLNSLEEGALVLFDAELARKLEAQFISDAARSKELSSD